MSSQDRVVVPKHILDGLKCVLCSSYLSVPPIVYNSDQHLICGRCLKKVTSGVLLNNTATAFEAVAKLLLFPCRYVSKGCTKQQLDWESVEGHEDSCEHRSYECPASYLASCTWEGNSKTLLQHFEEDHRHLLLKTDRFDLPLLCSCEDIKLMSVCSNTFLIHLVSDVEQGKVWVGVNYVYEQEVAADFSYKLEVKNVEDNNMLIFKNSVTSNRGWKFDKNASLELKMDSIKKILNVSKVLCKINISGVSKPEAAKSAAIDMELLSELECPVCFEYMISPIFVCQNGHSICGECKPKLRNCSNCRSPLGNARNIIMEKLTKHIAYPCKNRISGCNFVGNSSTISDHYKRCSLKTIDCPLKESERCMWKSAVGSCWGHVLSNHSHRTWMVAKQSLYRDLRSAIVTDFHIMNFEGQLFKICCKHSLKPAGSIAWTFQQVGLELDEPSRYKFEIEFLDQSNSGRKLIIDSLCRGITSDEDAFSNSMTLSYNLLEPFITKEKYLILKYDISAV